MQTVPIQMPDGSTVPVTLFPSEGRDDAPVIVVLPGLGIPGGYYRLFAEALVARGFHAAIGDLRGQGDSKPKPNSSSMSLVRSYFLAIISAPVNWLNEMPG